MPWKLPGPANVRGRAPAHGARGRPRPRSRAPRSAQSGNGVEQLGEEARRTPSRPAGPTDAVDVRRGRPARSSAAGRRARGVAAPRSTRARRAWSRWSGRRRWPSSFCLLGARHATLCIRCPADAAPTRKRELGRGERVLPGVWRLRLPLPWPGVPHCNAWAIAAGDGIVLVDTGMHEPGSLAQLERALDMVGLRVEHVRLLVCTHAHADHYGQAATIVERAGCELWMHPNHEHVTRRASTTPTRRSSGGIEVARQSGVPEEPLRRLRARRGAGRPPASPGSSSPTATCCRRRRDRRPTSATWTVVETPGPRALARLPVPARAPAADLRRPPARPRLALLRLRLHARPGRASSWPRWTRSRRSTRGCACRGHGRTFTDVQGHIAANRELVARAAGRARGRAARRRADDRLRRRPARLRRGAHRRSTRTGG